MRYKYLFYEQLTIDILLAAGGIVAWRVLRTLPDGGRGTLPDSAGTLPDGAGTLPDSAGTLPDGAGTLPDDAGTLPNTGGPEP